MNIIYQLKKLIPDTLYIQLQYYHHFHRFVDLKNPKTFNEKLQWLKLNDRNPLYTQLVDKYEVRKYIADKIGKDYLIPLVGGPWDSVDKIDFSTLPDQFVLKCTHDSGSVVICRDKNIFDQELCMQKLGECMKRNAFYYGREWLYKNVKPRIIAEQYMTDESMIELKDYKVFCFHGIPQIIQVDYGRFSNHERNMYSTEWECLKFTSKYPTNPMVLIEKPTNICELLSLASELSSVMPHARVDFYNVNGKLYFGEITLFHGSGFEKFYPDKWDQILGKLINLEKCFVS